MFVKCYCFFSRIHLFFLVYNFVTLFCNTLSNFIKRNFVNYMLVVICSCFKSPIIILLCTLPLHAEYELFVDTSLVEFISLNDYT